MIVLFIFCNIHTIGYCKQGQLVIQKGITFIGAVITSMKLTETAVWGYSSTLHQPVSRSSLHEAVVVASRSVCLWTC